MGAFRHLAKGVLILGLCVAPVALPAAAQTQDDDHSTKQDVKDAGHSTKEAGKKTGRDVKKGTKRVIHKSARKTGDAADKVQDKTREKDKDDAQPTRSSETR